MITKHARKRLKERKNSTGGSAEAHLKNVLSAGVMQKDLKGSLYDYVREKYVSHGKSANNCRVYKGFLYIIDNGTLITAYELPKELLENPEESFTPEGYIQYFHRAKDIKSLRGEELSVKMMELTNTYARLAGLDFHAVEFSYNCGAYRLMYKSETKWPRKQELDEMLHFFQFFIEKKIYTKRFQKEEPTPAVMDMTPSLENKIGIITDGNLP